MSSPQNFKADAAAFAGDGLRQGGQPAASPSTSKSGSDSAIGDIIRRTNNLSAEQVEQILSYQRERGVRFGEAAVALGLANSEDVVWALSQQFHYPYAEGKQKLAAELVSANEPFSERAEAFRAIRSQLIMRLNPKDSPRHAIAVVSPDVSDGKTYFAANIAIAFAQLGSRTLLVDCDMRSPRIHSLFGVEQSSSIGLSGVLSGRASSNVIVPVSDLSGLYLLPVGTIPPNPLELVERPAFGLLIRELLNKFDHVIVDTPAAAYGSDCTVIANRCGAALTVARRDKSRLAAMNSLLAAMQIANVQQAGVVLNEF